MARLLVVADEVRRCRSRRSRTARRRRRSRRPSRQRSRVCSRHASANGVRSDGAPPAGPGRGGTKPAPTSRRGRRASRRRRAPVSTATGSSSTHQRSPAKGADLLRPADRREPGEPGASARSRPRRAAGSASRARRCRCRWRHAFSVSCAATARSPANTRPASAVARPNASAAGGRQPRADHGADRHQRRSSDARRAGHEHAAVSAGVADRPRRTPSSSARPVSSSARVCRDDREDGSSSADQHARGTRRSPRGETADRREVDRPGRRGRRATGWPATPR